MNIYYNEKGIGNVLIFPIKESESKEFTTEKFDDVIKIKSNSGDTLGYNIFNATNYFVLEENGEIRLTEKWLEQIQSVFKQSGLNDSLNLDLSSKFVVGHVIDKKQHDNADKLSVCQVNVGSDVLQIVCGAANVDEGQNVVVAKVGAVMPSGLKIKATELRGVPSNGMICSKSELNLPTSDDEKGIYVLDSSYEIGTPFK